MVERGDLGRLRVIQAEYTQDWLTNDTQNKQADWRTDPKRAGAGAIGDIGTHAFNLLSFVSGLETEALSAELHSFVEGIKRAQAEGKYKGRAPKAMQQADKVKALVAAGVDKLKIQEQLNISKASYYRCLKAWECLYGASPLNQTWSLYFMWELFRQAPFSGVHPK